MGKQETLETIWEVPDELWERVEPIILEEDPPKARGRKRADPRQMLNGIIFRLRSGCQWNRLPKELGDDSTIHRPAFRWRPWRRGPPPCSRVVQSSVPPVCLFLFGLA